MAAEGLSLKRYLDGGGVATIGYGHTGPNLPDECTQAEAEQWLDDDADQATAYAVHLPEWGALDTPARRDAVVECVFNLGVKHWTDDFPLTRASIQAQDWPAACLHLLRSPEWVKQVGFSRVSRLANQLGSGEYPTTAATGS